MKLRFFFRGICLWLAVWVPLASSAHMLLAQQGTLNVVNDAVFVVLALPTAVVPQADTNGDDKLSEDEMRANTPLVLTRLRSGFRMRAQTGASGAEEGQVMLINPMAPPADEQHFVVLMKFQFSQPPQALELRTDLFGPREAEQQLTLKATRGQEVDVAILRPSHTTHQFFRGPLQVLGDYGVTGVEHIVFGADHVLFLVTIIVAGMGWRYWLVMLTSFTLAHSITLTLGLLGWVNVSPAIVEPAIAASIVLMAALNLRTHCFKSGSTPSYARQAAIVFACGLLHGLGFASSMADMGLHGSHRLASLLGFNLGIELGQALCLAAILLALRLTNSGFGMMARHWPAGNATAVPGWLSAHRWQAMPVLASVLASVLALGVGSVWLVQRLEMLG
jgi:hydrogenase/urease accessory protein HupE